MRLVRKTVALSANSTDYFKGDLVQTGTGQTTNHFICTSDHTSDTNARSEHRAGKTLTGTF